MLYWGTIDDLSVLIFILYSLCIYFGYALIRLTGGAPTAWYIIILSFFVVLVRRGVEMYYDVQSSSIPSSSIQEGVLSAVVGILMALGLYMLRNSFRRQLKLANEAHLLAS